MSFFVRGGGSDSSESDSDEESLLSESGSDAGAPKTLGKAKGSGSEGDSDEDSDSDDDDQRKKADAPAGAPRVSRFARGAVSDDSDESDDDEKGRVVRSAKSKRVDELEASAKRVENASRIDDWSTVNSEFDKLARLVASNPGGGIALTPEMASPPVWLKTITSLDESLNDPALKKKKLNATHNRALNTLRQKVKRSVRESEAVVVKYKEDPEAYQQRWEQAVAPAPATAPKPARSREPAAGAEADDAEFETVGRGGRTLNLTAEGVFKTLFAVLEARGKKSTDRAEQTRILEKLLALASTPYARLRVALALANSTFDYNQTTHSYMPLETWATARDKFDELLDVLDADRSYIVLENVGDYDEMVERSPSDDDKREIKDGIVHVRGSIVSLAERLGDEFTRSLREIDPHAIEYVQRLKDERPLYRVLVRAQAYLERIDQGENVERIVMRRLEHVYSKPTPVVEALERDLPALQSKVWPSPPPAGFTPGALVKALCVYLYQPETDPRLRMRALLCHVFHHALHGDFYRARDMMLMSHVQHAISGTDTETQIMYNRAIAQLGLSAFRAGRTEDAESILRDLYSNPTLVRERLAQGTQRRGIDSQITPEQEKLERSRQLPFHQHINLELLECAYLVASMLVEVPQIALESYDPERKRDVRSRLFRRQLEFFDKQIFAGPPENKRDYVVQAAKALQRGDWQRAISLVQSLKVWALLPNETEIKAIIERKIQEEGLRTYVFSHAAFFNTISLSSLADMFALPIPSVASVAGSMIWQEQLAGSLDSTGSPPMLHLHSSSRTPLQQMAVALADRTAAMLFENERTATAKLGDGSDGPKTSGDRDGGRAERGERRGARGTGERSRGGYSGRGARITGGALGSVRA